MTAWEFYSGVSLPRLAQLQLPIVPCEFHGSPGSCADEGEAGLRAEPFMLGAERIQRRRLTSSGVERSDRIKEKTPPATWARGVRLVREN